MLLLVFTIIAVCGAHTPAATATAAAGAFGAAAAAAASTQHGRSLAVAAPAPPAPAAPAAQQQQPQQQEGDAAADAAPNQQGEAAATRAPPPRSRLYNMSLEFDAADSDSQIMAAESIYANVLAVQFTFTACTGVNAHHHSNAETVQVPAGVVTVGVVSLSNEYTAFNVTQSQMLVIPAGNVHFYLNPTCNTSMMLATWPANTRTAFELPALEALPAGVFANLLAAAGPALAARPGFPLVTDPACAARCGLAPPSTTATG